MRLHGIILENSWNNHPINMVNDFIRLILSISTDRLFAKRLQMALFANSVGYATVVFQER
jgi:hypothetical protein